MDDDTEGHIRKLGIVPEEDDTEGHVRLTLPDDDDDTAGHMIRI